MARRRRGAARRGAAWRGAAWRGVVWCGVAWCGVGWHGRGVERYGKANACLLIGHRLRLPVPHLYGQLLKLLIENVDLQRGNCGVDLLRLLRLLDPPVQRLRATVSRGLLLVYDVQCFLQGGLAVYLLRGVQQSGQ